MSGSNRIRAGGSAARVALLALLLGAAIPSAAQETGEVPFPPVGDAAAEAPTDAVLRAWRAPAPDLQRRVDATVRAAHQRDLAGLDPLARAVLRMGSTGASPLERAEAAAALAPDLPWAQAALASARAEAGDWLGATRAAARGLVALPRHLEASLWTSATVGVLAVLALVGAAGLFLALQALGILPAATHDLGHWLPGSTAGYARAAWMGVLLGIPWLLGEGGMGFALVLLALVTCYGGAGGRRAALVAVALAALALGPLAQWSGSRLGALAADPLADAVWRAERGPLDPVAGARLETLAPGDPLGRRALARRAHRRGALEEADALYAGLLDEGADAGLWNDAANVRLALGRDQEAIDLYRRAAEARDSAVVWFNLSQAYAAKFRVEEHEQALQVAQSLDEDLVRELTDRLARLGSGVADLPLPTEALRSRLRPSRPPDPGATLRARLAPGRLGERPWLALGLFAAVAALGSAAGSRLESSRGCALCGGRICARCSDAREGDRLCAACGPRGERPSGFAAVAWKARRGALRLARPVAGALPGVLSDGRRPELTLGALVAGVAGAVFALGRGTVVPDPLAAGAVGTGALLGGGAVLAALGVFLLLMARRAR